MNANITQICDVIARMHVCQSFWGYWPSQSAIFRACSHAGKHVVVLIVKYVARCDEVWMYLPHDLPCIGRSQLLSHVRRCGKTPLSSYPASLVLTQCAQESSWDNSNSLAGDLAMLPAKQVREACSMHGASQSSYENWSR